MRDSTRLQISSLAKKIRNDLRGSTLFGEPVDVEDPDMVLVAAIAKGQCEEIMKRYPSTPRTPAQNEAIKMAGRVVSQHALDEARKQVTKVPNIDAINRERAKIGYGPIVGGLDMPEIP